LDERVNQVTPALFRKYPDARAMASADPAHVEKLIVKTGFFRQKTRSLMASAKMIVSFVTLLLDQAEAQAKLREMIG